MKKITLLLSSLFFFSLGTSACSDEAPSGNTEKPELPVNPARYPFGDFERLV